MYWQFLNTNTRILGSMHLVPSDSAGVPEWAFDAYRWAEEVVFESDPPAILPFLDSGSETGLQKRLSQASWQLLTSLWPESGPFPELARVRPWAAMLFSQVLVQKPALGVESAFLELAAREGKPVHFLETGAEVCDAFETAPVESVVRAIEAFAADPEAPKIQLQRMFEAWIGGDAQVIYDVASAAPSFKDPAIRQAVLGIRNRAWQEGLSRIVKAPRRTLIAVGALHLAGPGNVMELLGLPVQKLQLGSKA